MAAGAEVSASFSKREAGGYLGKQPTKFKLIVNRKTATRTSRCLKRMIAPTRSSSKLRFFRNCRLCFFDEANTPPHGRPPSFEAKPAVSPIGTSLQLRQCGDMQKLI
jgi:hypothetical protein